MIDPLDYRTIEVNGLALEVAVANEGGARGLALLLHGFPECAFSWRFQVRLLADLGYEVWAPNMRGYARSDKPPRVDDYALDFLVADVAALIDAAARDDVLLIGHDWGAAIAWMVAVRSVRPLDRLVIMNVPHPAAFRRELRGFRQLRRSWYVLFFQIPWLPEKLLGARRARAVGKAFTGMAVDKARFPAPVTDVYRENALRPGALTSMVNYYRAAFRGRKGAANEEFGAIEVPTLMLWGTEDAALSIETTHGTDEYVSDLTLRYLDGVSHWVQQEAPEKVNGLLRAWLDGESVPEASDIDAVRLIDPAFG